MRKTNNYKSKNYKKNKKNMTYKKKPSKHVNLVIGKIYADWCGYCQMMQNDWDSLKRDLGKKKKIEFVEIEQKNEADGMNIVNTKHLNKSQVKLSLQGGYPTVFKIRNGNLSYFNGNRVLEDMKKWVFE